MRLVFFHAGQWQRELDALALRAEPLGGARCRVVRLVGFSRLTTVCRGEWALQLARLSGLRCGAAGVATIRAPQISNPPYQRADIDPSPRCPYPRIEPAGEPKPQAPELGGRAGHHPIAPYPRVIATAGPQLKNKRAIRFPYVGTPVSTRQIFRKFHPNFGEHPGSSRFF